MEKQIERQISLELKANDHWYRLLNKSSNRMKKIQSKNIDIWNRVKSTSGGKIKNGDYLKINY